MFDSKLTYFARALVILSSLAALILCIHMNTALAQKINEKEGVQTRSSSGTGNTRVMVLNSYHPGYKWTGYLVEGIKQTLEDRIDNLKLYIEYMDTKRIKSDDYLQKYYEILRMKYTGVPLDLIIVSDDNAFQFLLRHHDELFGATPVVFCGVNNFKESMIKDKDYITGAVQAPSIKETIDTALDLHPGVEQIVVLSDASPTGQAYQRSVKKIAEGYGGLGFVYLDGKNLTHYDLFSRLSGLSKKSIVLLTIWLRDRNGNFLPMAEAIPIISSSSTAPLYGLIEVPLEYGMLGGKIQSGWYQGQKAAEIALQIILEGKSPVDVPVVMESPNKYIFAYQQLQRWRIPERKLPEGSIILGKPRSLYEENRYLIWSLLSILAFLMISVVVLATNNIKRRRAEKALKESERKYKDLQDASIDGHAWTDMEGHLIEVNNSFKNMMGYSEDALRKSTYNDITPEKWHASEQKILTEQILARGYSDPYEKELIRKDGTIVPVELRAYLIKDDQGNNKGMRAVVIDITERKKLEEERQKIHKLESVGILAGGIAHDFNNLLAAIRNNIYLSMMHVDRENIAYENLELTENIIHRATNLTQQLLTFSRGGAPVKKTASIIELINESAEFVLKGSNVACECKMEDNTWPVDVDEGQMNQVIHNLVLNAVQSMPKGGTIRISTENSNLGSDTGLPLKEGKYVKIIVQDQGVGITEEHLKNVFDPYFTTKDMGRGLGLSITYSIIKKHDGHISVESETGVGTAFTIYLPASEKQVEAKESVEDTFAAGEEKVLIMDDEEIIRDSVGQLLTLDGYEVECAKDGDEAIARYKKAMETSKPFNVVILDLTIRGGMGGQEVVKKLLEIDPDVKAIVASGYSNDPVLANFKEYGFCGVFTKSNKIEELRKTLYKVIKG